MNVIASQGPSLAERLNQGCSCVTLDRDALCAAMERESGDPAFCENEVKPRPNLFSNVPVFLAATVINEMAEVVGAIEATAELPQYREAVLAWAPSIAAMDFRPCGALMGYDFHVGQDGPKLIEVNTNAGGAFLNALLSRAQRACCAEMAPSLPVTARQSFEEDVAAMFRNEWQLQRGPGEPTRIAIVDDRPRDQYLYPEFVIAQRMLAAQGLATVIADPASLLFQAGRLVSRDGPIDLVYNRLTDFAFSAPGHAALQQAYMTGAVVVTPSPRNHALLADKRNLTLLSDPALLANWGVDPEVRRHLAAVPRTTSVTPRNASELWDRRKTLFFKPDGGHGSKAVYRGDKITKGVWTEVSRGGYVAQELVQPGERIVLIDGVREERKMDVRLYTYQGRVLMTAARLYQGQTTNFRTPGGGFAPVFAI